jgi:hypothetical protein
VKQTQTTKPRTYPRDRNIETQGLDLGSVQRSRTSPTQAVLSFVSGASQLIVYTSDESGILSMDLHTSSGVDLYSFVELTVRSHHFCHHRQLPLSLLTFAC